MTRHLTALMLLVVLIWPGGIHASGSRVEDIPVDSWVYDALFELSTEGELPGLLLHTRPLSRGEIADAIRQFRTDHTPLSPGISAVLSRLEGEFHEELAEPDKIATDHRIRLGGGPTARSDQFRHRLALNRVGFDATGSFTVANAVAARMRVRFDSDGRQDSQFHGKFWKEKFTAWVEQAVLVARWKRVTAAFGREYWRWGLSPNDAMLMSDQSPPFDGLRLMYRARTWSFAFHATVLDRMYVSPQDYSDGIGQEGQTNRYLVAHRFNWRPWDNLEVAASEAMLFGGFDRPWEWNYLNPLLPYYWEQLNDNTNDNPLWNLELSWRVTDGLKVYGEWLIDDFQIDFHSEPQQIGILIGSIWIPRVLDGRLRLNGEYQRINTFVYGQDRPWNRYFNERDFNGAVVGIGSELGPDADRITVLPIYHLTSAIDLTATIDYRRRGEYRFDQPQPSGVPKDTPFPSGTVESKLQLAVGTRLQRRGQIVADALVGRYSIDNLANIDGSDIDGFFFQFKLNALWWKTFGV